MQYFQIAGLKIKPSMSELFQREARYQGHVANERGVTTDPDKVAPVREWTRPTGLAKVEAFLGFVGYYRRFFKDYTTLARLLNKLTAKREEFLWRRRRNTRSQPSRE